LLLDQLLETVHKRGRRVHLYMNEMALEERVTRYLTRQTGVPYQRIISGKTDAEQNKAIVASLAHGIPFGITLVAGWSAEEIAHHIRRNNWDVAAVDILHLIEFEDERELSRISATLNRCAKQADCALVATVHLNEKRVLSATRPRPTLGDIRNSGSLKNDADVVCFVYREQDPETGEPLPEGAIYFSKVRNGEVGGIPVRFNASRLRFERASNAQSEAPMAATGNGPAW
jgi:replicative DNA helicase